MQPAIKTYTTEGFRQKYMQPAQQLNSMLKNGFGRFFIVRVQDMLRLIKLPVPPARSTTHTIIYLTHGEAVMTIGSQTHTIYKNQLLVVPAGQVMSFSNLDSNKGYLCHFHNDMLAGKHIKANPLTHFPFLNVWAHPRIVPDKATAVRLLHNLKTLLHEYSHHGLNGIIEPYFLAFLSEVNRAYLASPATPANTANTTLNRFKEMLHRRIGTMHRVSQYAQQLNITPNHLNKVVKTLTGKPATKWIDEARVMEAKVLLYQSQLPINRVAAEAGFTDPSYFTRLFKKYEGVTPAQYRKMIE